MVTAVDRLVQMGLAPPPWKGRVDLIPSGHDVDLRDRYRGVMLGVAIGDALGRPVEGKPPSVIAAHFGVLRDFVPWHGWTQGPKGTITDDTQMTMCLARTYLDCGHLNPEDLATRFVDWMAYGRGKGRACVAACTNLKDGIPWWEAGVGSAGNGAAMRAAPVGLANGRSLEMIRHDGTLSAVMTHADGMAAASAVAVGYLVASLSRTPATAFDLGHLMEGLHEVLDDLPDSGHPERRPGSGPEPVRLVDRLALVPDLLPFDRDHAFGVLHNGAFVLESLPAALWAFLKRPHSPEEAVILAANGGYDADTVAAMTGAFAGALNGASAWPARWIEDLEYADQLTDMADGLLELAVT